MNVEAEQAVLGSCLISYRSTLVAVGMLSEEDFQNKAHRHIWRAITKLADSDCPPDVLTVPQELGRTEGLLESVGGMAYITKLADATPTASHVNHYADLVREASQRVALKSVGQKLTQMSEDKSKTITEIATEASGEIRKATHKKKADLDHSLTADRVFANWMAKFEGEVKQHVQTGFTELDKKLPGLMPGTLMVLAGRPSMGKTALMISMMLNAAVRYEDMSQMMFSLEMSREDLMARIASWMTGAHVGNFLRNELTAEKAVEVARRMRNPAMERLIIDDVRTRTISDIKAQAALQSTIMAKKGTPLKVIYVDYLQIISTLGKSGSVHNELTEVAKGLKTIARELDCCVVTGSQLNRFGESDGEKPKLHRLRDSGGIEAEADVVIGVHKVYTEEPIQNAELLILKQRQGPLGEIPIQFHAPCVRYMDKGAIPMSNPFIHLTREMPF